MARDLRPVYAAPTEQAANERLNEFHARIIVRAELVERHPSGTYSQLRDSDRLSAAPAP